MVPFDLFIRTASALQLIGSAVNKRTSPDVAMLFILELSFKETNWSSMRSTSVIPQALSPLTRPRNTRRKPSPTLTLTALTGMRLPRCTLTHSYPVAERRDGKPDH